MTDGSPQMTPEALKALLGLTSDQAEAAVESGRDVVVTAGAGTGKTQTLVARYLWHLGNGLTPREVAAITFTEKAAREMRNRIRTQVAVLANEGPEDQRPAWTELEAQMDAARIGTIHSLCAEILRAHPAQAEVDPGFEVVDEGWSAALKAQAVEDALVWAVADEGTAPLFTAYRPFALRGVLSELLDRRLDTSDAFDVVHESDWMAGSAVDGALRQFAESKSVLDDVGILAHEARSGSGPSGMTAGMAAQVAAFLAGWEALQAALDDGSPIEAAAVLFDLRRAAMRLNVGRKDGPARGAFERLRRQYDASLEPWLGGGKASDPRPDPATETRFAEDLSRLRTLFGQVERSYRAQLDLRRAVDFDDLESGARSLLAEADIRRRWGDAIRAVLVDEYQDTNARQQEVIRKLAGEGEGKLFVVGDARQSIYRFRGADVTVFRRLRNRLTRSGGMAFDLSKTFRSHSGLLAGQDAILSRVMGTDDSEELYKVPYTALTPNRSESRSVSAPFIELVLGLGERADDARPRSAKALCARLLELRDDGQIGSWDQVALLFRASTGFDDYERALEAAGIPFVTVAGRGFYDRPEIRDLLNTLRLLADPTDDLAMAGFLRSPAIGMTDEGIFTLRLADGQTQPLLDAVMSGDDRLSEADRACVERARIVLDDLLPLVDRLPVVELIKRVVDRLDLRAILAASHSRLWRNVDKLVDDAQASQVVRLTEFLAYLRTLRAVGAREGEAPVEAEGAVRLMTIHKAKGLEFDFTVLADASRRRPSGRERVYVSSIVGVAPRPDRLEGESLAYRLAAAVDRSQADAEEQRLLYVAATRAREKLLICGHVSQAWGRWTAAGWLKSVLDVLGLSVEALAGEPGQRRLDAVPGGQIELLVAADDPPLRVVSQTTPAWPSSRETDLFQPVEVVQIESTDDDLDEGPERSWRATQTDAGVPGAALGRMVHTALQRESLPPDESFRRLMEAEALRAGLVQPDQRAEALNQAEMLLTRLTGHPIWDDIMRADPRLHEVPFTSPTAAGWARSGIIDLLYRLDDTWVVLDFKTEHLPDEEEMELAAERYIHEQIRPYVRATSGLMDVRPVGRLCFLDVHGEVCLVDMPD